MNSYFIDKKEKYKEGREGKKIRKIQPILCFLHLRALLPWDPVLCLQMAQSGWRQWTYQNHKNLACLTVETGRHKLLSGSHLGEGVGPVFHGMFKLPVLQENGHHFFSEFFRAASALFA